MHMNQSQLDFHIIKREPYIQELKILQRLRSFLINLIKSAFEKYKQMHSEVAQTTKLYYSSIKFRVQ